MSKAQNVNPEFCRRLRSRRKSKGLSRAALSKIIEDNTGAIITDKMIYNYETGYNKMRGDISEKLAAALECDPLYFTDENFKYPTRNDEFAAVMKQSHEEDYYMNLAVVALLKLNGYEVAFSELSNIDAETAIKNVHNRYIVVSKNEKEVFSLGIFELSKLGNNLDKIFNVLLTYYLDNEG